ncbi:hypothetical protein BDZ90DRAFT_51215 [Jaminaea rosea]|uniref:Uncharacterized protein n=1 Tax=Jaminaea rosea TaxID=1569628 RepID=A0A316UMV2_9BASI|nr:hypothetical protein BDZ90DRAFT_51215 [Jaminaea rosea]PWN26294.1 hypothetical protein BDZ90DRAFT_51215 [Jaminaea rosea]
MRCDVGRGVELLRCVRRAKRSGAEIGLLPCRSEEVRGCRRELRLSRCSRWCMCVDGDEEDSSGLSLKGGRGEAGWVLLEVAWCGRGVKICGEFEQLGGWDRPNERGDDERGNEGGGGGTTRPRWLSDWCLVGWLALPRAHLSLVAFDCRRACAAASDRPARRHDDSHLASRRSAHRDHSTSRRMLNDKPPQVSPSRSRS